MNRVPLAERMRPIKLSEVLGQDKIIGEGKILTEIVRKGEPVNLIFWGLRIFAQSFFYMQNLNQFNRKEMIYMKL